MDEARRFLRYVTPGLVFLTETLIILELIEPNVIQTILKGFSKDSGIGLVIATLLASGGVGFMFSVVHHFFHWFGQHGVIDHRQSIASLRGRGIIQLRNRESGEIISTNVIPNRFQAWTIFAGLWHERLLSEDSPIKSADPRASSLSDLVHSVGTARIAAIAAWITSLFILVWTCERSWEFWAVVRFFFGNILAGGFVWLYHNGYKRTGDATKRLAEQVIEDALTQEQKKKGVPIDTYVAL